MVHLSGLEELHQPGLFDRSQHMFTEAHNQTVEEEGQWNEDRQRKDHASHHDGVIETSEPPKRGGIQGGPHPSSAGGVRI